MIRASATTLIARTPQQVFEFIGNFPKNYQRWSPEVVELKIYTSGPVRVGTRARQVRIDQGRRTETTFSVTAFEPSRRVQFQGTTDSFRATYQLAPAADRTRLTFTFELMRMDLFMRPFEKLIRVAVQQGTERVVRNICGLVEGETAAEPSQPIHHPE